jgi:hypothetical protein
MYSLKEAVNEPGVGYRPNKQGCQPRVKSKAEVSQRLAGAGLELQDEDKPKERVIVQTHQTDSTAAMGV